MARLSQLLRSAKSSSEPSYCPDRGDFIKIDFDPQAGREQAGRRPALVLSPKNYNEKTRLCIVCAMTNQVKGYPFEVPAPGTEDVGGGVVLADHVKSLDWSERRASFHGRASESLVIDVLAKFKTLIG